MARKQFLALALALGGFAAQAILPGVASADGGGGLLGGLTTTITNVTTGVTDTVDQTLANVTNPQNQNDEPSAVQDDLLPSLTESVAATAAPVTQAVSSTLDPLTQTVGETLAPVSQSLAETASPLSEALAPVSETLAPVLEPVTTALAPVIESAAPVLAPLTEATGGVLAPVVEALQPALEPLTDIVQPVLQPIGDAVRPVLDPIIDLTHPILDPIIEVIQPVTDPIGEVLEPVVDPIEDIISPVLDPIVDPVTPNPIFDPVTPGPIGETPVTLPGTDPSGGTPGFIAPSAASELLGDLPSLLASGGLAGDAVDGVPSMFGDGSTFTDGFAEDLTPAGFGVASSPAALSALSTGLGLSNGAPGGQPLFGAPDAPRAPLDAPAGSSVSQVSVVSGSGGNNHTPRFDWPSASLPAGLLGLFALGVLLLLAVTEASPRTWQFRPYTPPA